MPVGHKQPCPCGSGKKYKHCCMEKDSRRRQSGLWGTLAAAVAVLVLAAVVVGIRDESGSVHASAGLEALILTGDAGAEVSDLLLEAMTGRENDDG